MKKILLFGDSNTWGHNPVDFTQLPRTWGVILRERFPEYEITIDGSCGRATDFGEGDKNGIEAFRQRYLNGNNRFDLIIIMLGTNDMLNHLNYEPEKTASILRAYIRESRNMYGAEKPLFLLISPILINENVLRHPTFMELYSRTSIDNSKRFAECISKAAASENIFFLNAADTARASDIDGVHMEPEEHEKLADAAEKKIREIFGSDQ